MEGEEEEEEAEEEADIEAAVAGPQSGNDLQGGEEDIQEEGDNVYEEEDGGMYSGTDEDGDSNGNDNNDNEEAWALIR